MSYIGNINGTAFDMLDNLRKHDKGERARDTIARLTPAKQKRIYKLGNYIARSMTGQAGKTGEYKRACKKR